MQCQGFTKGRIAREGMQQSMPVSQSGAPLESEPQRPTLSGCGCGLPAAPGNRHAGGRTSCRVGLPLPR